MFAAYSASKAAKIPKTTKSSTGVKKAKTPRAQRQALKRNTVKQMSATADSFHQNSGTQVLYNIDANNVLALGETQPIKQKYTDEDKKRLYSDFDDGTKVAAIAQKIRELTQNTEDPVARERVLSEFKVKFNNQIMTLKEFLALCG